MSDQVTDVVVEPESPSSPQTLIVDLLLLGLEYYLVKWLLAKWGIFQKNNQPTRRCVKKLQLPTIPTTPPSQFVFILGEDYFNKTMTNASSRGFEYATYRLTPQNPMWPEWKGWTWHIRVRTSDGSTDAKTCYFWNIACPSQQIPADPDDEKSTNIYWPLVCGCPSGDTCTGDNPTACLYQDPKQNGIFNWFFQKWQASTNAMQTPACPCPHQSLMSVCCLESQACANLCQ